MIIHRLSPKSGNDGKIYACSLATSTIITFNQFIVWMLSGSY